MIEFPETDSAYEPSILLFMVMIYERYKSKRVQMRNIVMIHDLEFFDVHCSLSASLHSEARHEQRTLVFGQRCHEFGTGWQRCHFIPLRPIATIYYQYIWELRCYFQNVKRLAESGCWIFDHFSFFPFDCVLRMTIELRPLWFQRPSVGSIRFWRGVDGFSDEIDLSVIALNQPEAVTFLDIAKPSTDQDSMTNNILYSLRLKLRNVFQPKFPNRLHNCTQDGGNCNWILLRNFFSTRPKGSFQQFPKGSLKEFFRKYFQNINRHWSIDQSNPEYVKACNGERSMEIPNKLETNQIC